jgi:hypothetical protein
MAGKTTNARAKAVYNTHMSEGKKSENSVLRHVPSVDQLLHTEVAHQLGKSLGLKRVTAIARTVTAEIRLLIRHLLLSHHLLKKAPVLRALLSFSCIVYS